MPSTRRRAETEFESTPTQTGTQTLTLSGLTGGRNGYTNPELMSPQFWTGATQNVYSGQHGNVRRARWAPISTIPNYANGTIIRDIFSFTPPGGRPFLICDSEAPSISASVQFVLQYGSIFTSGIPLLFGVPISASDFYGPYMRFSPLPAFILQTNGMVRTKIVYVNFATWFLESWGIDAPDAAPAVGLSTGQSGTISTIASVSNVVTVTLTGVLPGEFITGAWVNISGVTDTTFNTATGTAVQILSTGATTFTYFSVGTDRSSAAGTATTQITKTIGRSYQFAWENANTGHVSAPSPATQYVQYSNQIGDIFFVEPGTIAYSPANNTITGTNTFFTSAWIGRSLWGSTQGTLGPIISVSSNTSMKVASNPAFTATTDKFQIYDQQSTHVRIYATGDGGAVYLRIGRNIFTPGASGTTGAGLDFIDTANSEPPNAPFTNEISQSQNVPPPIGTFLQDYQGRILVYGVLGALQSFFYSNIESTVVGQPPESFAPLNQVTLPVGESQLNGMANLPTGCVMWSSKQDMFKLTGTLTDNTIANAQQLGATIQRLPYKIGCASPYATAVTSLGAFWFSSDREVWLFTDHYAPKNIGKPIQDLLNKATRIGFARMKNYKSGDRNWIALAITTKGGSFNDTLCLLDLDLLASNGQPSFFTFDMATNQPSWYIYNVNCESIESAFDASSINHLLAGDVDLITDLDWTDGYYTVTAERSIPAPQLTLHALGNENPEVIKTGRWMRVTTNQLPKNLPSQGWNWNILCYDDDKYVLGINPQIVQLVPGVNSPNQVFALEYSPSVFRFGGLKPVKGRRFQIQANFPSGPGFYELRGYQVSFDSIVER